MQNKIDTIIYSSASFTQKINNLKTLFKKEEVLLFSDFDDTITNNTCLLYSKIKFIKYYKKQNNLSFLLKNFKINNSFIKLLKQRKKKEIIILSRNDHEFIKFFIQKTKTSFHKHKIKIIWWVGTTDIFQTKSHHKISILPHNAFLITDIFEYRQLKDYKNIIYIEHYNKLKLIYKTCLKLLYFAKFVITNGKNTRKTI